MSIQRLTVFPPVSKLDPSIYGPQESALKEEHIIGHLNGMSIQQVYMSRKQKPLKDKYIKQRKDSLKCMDDICGFCRH